MPPIIKYTKDDVINVSYKIMKEEGLEQLNARKIAKALNCSVQPIFSNFANMDDLKNQLIKKATNEFYNYITKKTDNNIPEYKQVGINYIKFAKEEPIIFNILFMQKTNLYPNDFILMDNDFSVLEKIINRSAKIDDSEIKEFHIKMWLFTHGIASLVATNTCIFTENQISDLLSSEFQALMLLEENPNNKWVLQKGEIKNDSN